jgi:hypothetical protein
MKPCYFCHRLVFFNSFGPRIDPNHADLPNEHTRIVTYRVDNSGKPYKVEYVAHTECLELAEVWFQEPIEIPIPVSKGDAA